MIELVIAIGMVLFEDGRIGNSNRYGVVSL